MGVLYLISFSTHMEKILSLLEREEKHHKGGAEVYSLPGPPTTISLLSHYDLSTRLFKLANQELLLTRPSDSGSSLFHFWPHVFCGLSRLVWKCNQLACLGRYLDLEYFFLALPLSFCNSLSIYKLILYCCTFNSFSIRMSFNFILILIL